MKNYHRNKSYFKRVGKMDSTLWFDWDNFKSDYDFGCTKFSKITGTKNLNIFNQYYNENKISKDKLKLIEEHYNTDLSKYVFESQSKLIRSKL